MDKREIFKKLVEAGWNVEQIRLGFDSIQEAGKVKTMPKQPKNELVNYIKRALDMKIPEQTIRTNLSLRGWNKEDVEIAFKSAKKSEFLKKFKIIRIKKK